jgi:hypothetical protein
MRKAHKWIIVLVAYDDRRIKTRVIKERLPIDENDQLAALLRGGQLVTVIDVDDEAVAEAHRIEVEKTCFR